MDRTHHMKDSLFHPLMLTASTKPHLNNVQKITIKGLTGRNCWEAGQLIRGFKKPVFLEKKPNPVGFLGFGVLLGFFGQAGKNR